jgi:hypothetical protein
MWGNRIHGEAGATPPFEASASSAPTLPCILEIGAGF